MRFIGSSARGWADAADALRNKDENGFDNLGPSYLFLIQFRPLIRSAFWPMKIDLTSRLTFKATLLTVCGTPSSCYFVMMVKFWDQPHIDIRGPYKRAALYTYVS